MRAVHAAPVPQETREEKPSSADPTRNLNMAPPDVALVTGASGITGRHLVDALLRRRTQGKNGQAWRVVTLTRRDLEGLSAEDAKDVTQAGGPGRAGGEGGEGAAPPAGACWPPIASPRLAPRAPFLALFRRCSHLFLSTLVQPRGGTASRAPPAGMHLTALRPLAPAAGQG